MAVLLQFHSVLSVRAKEQALRPRAGCIPNSSLAPTFERPPFSPSVLPRLLLPRDKLSSSPPEWDRVKFRSNSAPSSSVRGGQTHSENRWLARPGLWGLRCGFQGRREDCFPPHPPLAHRSRKRSPLLVPCKPEGPSSEEGPLRTNPRVAMGLRGRWGPDCIAKGSSAPLRALQPHIWTEPMSMELKITHPLCYCKRTLLGLQGRVRTQSSEGQFPAPLHPAFP